MKHRKIMTATGAVLCAALLSFGTLSVYAEDAANSSEQSPDSSSSSSEVMQNTAESMNARDTLKQEAEKLRTEAKNAKERAQNLKDRLAGRRLQACENHQAAIQRILTRAAARGQNHLSLFATITDRVETFYKNKGKTLATYEQLVSDIGVKKAAAAVAVASVKADSATFACTSDNPKAQVEAARAEVKAEIAALKEYRTAVKNLIVGVKSVQSTSENGA